MAFRCPYNFSGLKANRSHMYWRWFPALLPLLTTVVTVTTKGLVIVVLVSRPDASCVKCLPHRRGQCDNRTQRIFLIASSSTLFSVASSCLAPSCIIEHNHAPADLAQSVSSTVTTPPAILLSLLPFPNHTSIGIAFLFGPMWYKHLQTVPISCLQWGRPMAEEFFPSSFRWSQTVLVAEMM